MLTYIEPCGWCSSSISSLKCPSKSIESYQNPSPSLSQLSISSSRNSLKSYQKTAFSTPIIRSTYSHPHDYHSRKRIDELHERLDEIQIRNFLKFINYHLALNKSDINLQIDDFLADLSNGHLFLDLIEKFSSTKLPREHGRTRFHSLTNVQHVLDYFKSHQQYINISSNDIVSGNRKQILALLWMIMKYFDFPNFRLMNKNCFQEKTLLSSGQDRSVLLNWLNNLLNQCLIDQQNLLKDFYVQTWINGYYLSSILKYLVPISRNYSTMKSFDYLKQLNTKSCEQCFEICLNLSNYCFHTSLDMNYDDRTEISLLKYFSDLQKNIFQLIQSDHIDKLVQINPYTKQILQTIEQNPSNIINVNEQYLVCIQENRKSDSIEAEKLNEKRDKEDVVLDEDVDRLVLKVTDEAIEEINRILSSNENDQSSNIDICTNEREKNVCLTVEVNEPIAIDPVEESENVTINLPLIEEISDEQTISINDEDEQLVPEINEFKSSICSIEESVQPIILTEESIEMSSVDSRKEIVDQTIIEIPSEPIVVCDETETSISNNIDNEIEITSNDKLEEQIVPLVEPESSEKIEQISNTFVENVNNQTEESVIKSIEIPTRLPSIKLEVSVVKEVQPQQSTVSNGYRNPPTTYRNKNFSHSPRKFIPNNSHSQSTIVVDKPEVRQIPNEISVQTAATTPVRCSKYSDVVSQSVPSMKKKKVIPNEPPKQSIIITEEIRTVPPKQPEPPIQLESIQQEQPKKSSNKNKKSKRSNAKKAQPPKNTSIITTEISIPSIIDEQPSISLVVDDPEPVIEIPTTIPTNNNENSSVLRSRRSRRRKTVATKTTTVIEKTSSSSNGIASNRNFFVVVNECLRDRKLIAFKCVIILVCLCFSIIILVLSHK